MFVRWAHLVGVTSPYHLNKIPDAAAGWVQGDVLSMFSSSSADSFTAVVTFSGAAAAANFSAALSGAVEDAESLYRPGPGAGAALQPAMGHGAAGDACVVHAEVPWSVHRREFFASPTGWLRGSHIPRLDWLDTRCRARLKRCLMEKKSD